MVQAYDYAGSWNSKSGHQSNLYPSHHNPLSTFFSTSAALYYYVSRGVRPNKIVLGMPLYGRAFSSTDGPGKPFSGTGEGSWEQGVWDYKALPQKGATELIDHNCKASWSFDTEKRLMVSYDTIEMAKIKAEYVKKEGLGGAMWWESSGDKAGEGSIIAKVSIETLGSSTKPTSDLELQVVQELAYLDRSNNTLSYPESKYDNLRNGFP